MKGASGEVRLKEKERKEVPLKETNYIPLMPVLKAQAILHEDLL